MAIQQDGDNFVVDVGVVDRGIVGPAAAASLQAYFEVGGSGGVEVRFSAPKLPAPTLIRSPVESNTDFEMI